MRSTPGWGLPTYRERVDGSGSLGGLWGRHSGTRGSLTMEVCSCSCVVPYTNLGKPLKLKKSMELSILF